MSTSADGSADVGAVATRVDEPARRVTFGLVGDIHMHRGVNRSGDLGNGTFDFVPMFARIQPLVSWFDVGLCHMEQPFAPPGTPVYVAPPQLSSSFELADGLVAAGFDRCGTASNHAMDRGTAGVDFTLNKMDEAGLGHAGSARNAAEAKPALFTVNGVVFAHLAFTFATGPMPSGQSWRVNVTNSTRIIADARAARAAGAQVVILDLEWGVDKIVQPTSQQKQLAATLTATGEFDLIFGHQAHVLQPITKVNDTWVIYGLGNLVSDHPSGPSWPAASQDGAVVMVDFTVDDGVVTVGRPVVYPTWCDRTNGHVVLPTSLATDMTLPAWKRAALAASTERTRAVVGAFLAPGI